MTPDDTAELIEAISALPGVDSISLIDPCPHDNVPECCDRCNPGNGWYRVDFQDFRDKYGDDCDDYH